MKEKLKEFKANLYRVPQHIHHFRHRYFENWIFVHINKTAGTSITKALKIKFEHKSAKRFIRDIGREKWDNAYTFAFVRNPWDRVVSQYHWRVKSKQTNLGTNPISFNEWVKRAYGEQAPQYLDMPFFFMPQYDWLCDDEDTIIVDFVGRFETINRDFQYVCQQINREASLPHVKSSKRAAYSTYFDKETQEIVAQHYKKDIDAFDYKFDTFS